MLAAAPEIRRRSRHTCEGSGSASRSSRTGASPRESERGPRRRQDAWSSSSFNGCCRYRESDRTGRRRTSRPGRRPSPRAHPRYIGLHVIDQIADKHDARVSAKRSTLLLRPRRYSPCRRDVCRASVSADGIRECGRTDQLPPSAPNLFSSSYPPSTCRRPAPGLVGWRPMRHNTLPTTRRRTTRAMRLDSSYGNVAVISTDSKSELSARRGRPWLNPTRTACYREWGRGVERSV
jgi:hypothetical protein